MNISFKIKLGQHERDYKLFIRAACFFCSAMNNVVCSRLSMVPDIDLRVTPHGRLSCNGGLLKVEIVYNHGNTRRDIYVGFSYDEELQITALFINGVKQTPSDVLTTIMNKVPV